MAVATLAGIGVFGAIVPAHAQNVVASWIQLAPGSSAAALANGSYGDQPTSLTPTILARAVVSDGVCPALTVDGTLPITMKVRVTGASLTNTPGTSGFTNGKTGYPQYFVASTATSPGNFPDGTTKVTTSWAQCEAVVPAGHNSATIGSTALKLPVSKPKRILVIGDTGCRMATSNQQDCHSASGFPFAALAAYEAQFKPDLIVQVGDYFYRDTSCIVPASGNTPAHEYVAGCNDPTNANYETWGDTWDSWNGDLFYPARTLLAAAPWIMTRGNHESCGRGARGWYALIDPRPYNANGVVCAGTPSPYPYPPNGTTPSYTADFEPTYVVPAGSVNFLVHDSSFANDSAVDSNMAANYDVDLTAILAAVPSSSYNVFTTHKPTYGLVSGGTDLNAPPPVPTNNGGDYTEQFTFSGNAAANSGFSGGVPYKIPLFLSGHIHQFEYVNFQDWTHYAPQLIVGVGGDNLDPTSNPNGTTVTYGFKSQNFVVHASGTTSTTTSTVATAAFAQAEFGFAVLDVTATGYVANVYNIGAAKAGRCTITLSPRSIACWD